MRKLFTAILALAGVSLLLVPAFADIEQAMTPERGKATRAAKLRTSLDPTDPDTVWIGHIYDATFTAGGTMPAGGFGPYHIGRGPNHVTKSAGTFGDNGTWDFDRFQFTDRDSLQGWWPVTRCFQSGATTFPDYRRAMFALDHGNQVNYVINQGQPKRTFGVTGLWHRDRGSAAFAPSDTVAGHNVQQVKWTATEVGGAGSTASAWMGIRSAGDVSAVDLTGNGGTGNAFNADLLQYQGNNGFNGVGSVSVNGTDHSFPGYGSQLDQMLYRDVTLAEGDGLTISFNFSTNMSTDKNTATGVRAGWFDKDPVSNAQVGVGPGATPSNDGNFISSDVAGASAPCDSFMVYVGAPVDDNNVTFSAPLFVGGNEITTVYDKKRRWFSEVLQLSGNCPSCTIIGKEIVSSAGNHTPAAVSLNFGTTYPAALQAIKDADGQTGNGGTVRIVFRVKTNRGYDDENGGNPSASFDSGTRGAAIVDNVVVNGWAAANGNFEAANSINNDTAVLPTAAWKSTGKPPSVYFHTHSVLPGQGLAFNDPCGGIDNPNRQCNLYGKVLTPGDHDEAEKDGGLFGSNTQDRQRWAVSPTVNLSSTANGVYNGMGIDDEIARTTTDYNCLFSYYNAGNVNATTATGNFLSIGYQSYPARQDNGNICWGEARHGTSIFFYGVRACFETSDLGGGAKAGGLIRTTNPENRPDSLRLYIQRISRCYTFAALTAATCSPITGDNVGTYFDNISIAMIDGAAPPEINIPIWMLINDAFPANGNDALIPAGFDTCGAQVRIGINIAANTGTIGRPAISGDSVWMTAQGPNVRMDMVFRILPGPGNYRTLGVKASGVLRRPDVAGVLATPGDGSFFGEYMASPGQFGAGNHTGGWNQNTWNSARMDTAKLNLFPTANNGGIIGLAAGQWAGTIHESDPKFSTLGITKFICAMTAPGGATNSTNIQCDGTNWGAYGVGSGWNGVTTTKEMTKIIPDGLLTPGSHVQYFFRKSNVATPATFVMAPDTNLVFQAAEGSNDGHRWQQFGVLPDRWKDGAWSTADRNAPAPACMLYVDWEDRRGDERVWVGIADSIGATAQARWGAHNGWHARGDQDITVAIGTDPTIAVVKNGGQPGTIWDMFGIKASESSTTSSSLGSRTTTDPAGLQVGKKNLNGPSGLMLRQYYRILLILTGDLNAGNIGPYVDKGDNDVGLLADFASGVAGTSKPRALWVSGRGFVEGQETGGASGHVGFVPAQFGAGLRSGDYRGYSANTNDIIDLSPNAPIVTNGNKYSVSNVCTITNDVLTTVGTFGSIMAGKYEDSNTGINPKISSVYAPSTYPNTTDHESVTLVEGFRIQSLGTWKTLTSQGTIDYYFNVITNLFSSLNCLLAPGQVIGVGDLPNNALVNFLQLRSENPMRSGMAAISFGVTRKEHVELKVYDVTGRLVKTLANREFDPAAGSPKGQFTIHWDGTNDDGQKVARGVYFYQLRTPSFVSQKKLAVLSN